MSVCVCVCAQSCLTLWDPVNYSPPGSSVHGISQARILEQVTISYSRGYSWPRGGNCVSSVSCIDRWILYHQQHLGSQVLATALIEEQVLAELEKAMAPHSSALAWKIQWTEEPGGLQSTGSLRVGHDWATSLSLFTFMHWRRKWHPTPVFLPGESQGRGSLVGCRLWGRTETYTTEAT